VNTSQHPLADNLDIAKNLSKNKALRLTKERIVTECIHIFQEITIKEGTQLYRDYYKISNEVLKNKYPVSFRAD